MARLLTALLILASLSGCATLVRSRAVAMAEDLNAAILAQDDPATVRDGAPAYLLLIDGLIQGDPGSHDLLLAGARLYGAYVSAFVDDDERARRLATKARSYGRRALCARVTDLCEAVHSPFGTFLPVVEETRRRDVPTLYGFASAWAVWVQANSDDWKAIADIPRIEALMRRVVELDEAHERGAPHLYLGVLLTLVPPSLGGRTEEAREHFERAIALTEGRDLMVKVLFAEQYARLVFDRDLHDGLLRDVLRADPEVPRLTLSNTLAQERAAALLEGADEYF
jgi:hypothetical protein